MAGWNASLSATSPMQNIQGGCTAPTGWGLHWLTAFPARGDQWNQSRGSAYNSEDWRGGRVKLIPANSGLPGITPIRFYRMRITSVPLYLAVTRFQKRRGRAALGGDFKRSLLSLFWGSFLVFPFLLCLRSDAFRRLKGRRYFPASRNI